MHLSSKAAGAEEGSRRFHDMDSLRAAMMLLGLVFHVAWILLPVYFGQALNDSQDSNAFFHFFCWVHTFRMQVFFLIAGFFACLLIRKRGQLHFLKNRLLRVAVPFLMAMLIIWPLMKWQILRGALVSGRIISDEDLATQYWNVMTNVDWANEWPVHLWFLECLLLVYAISLMLRLLFDWALDRKNTVRPRLSSAVNYLTSSYLGPFLFAIPVALLTAYGNGWLGIDSGPLKPVWSGVWAYWVFFAVGWSLHAAPELIDNFLKRWVAYLFVGSLLAIILGGYFQRLWMSGRVPFFYPVILDVDIDYPALRGQLLPEQREPSEDAHAAGKHASQRPELAVIWELLSPTYQQFLVNKEAPTSDQLTGFSLELSMKTVLNPQFQTLLADANGSAAIEKAEGAAFDPIANREILAAITDGAVTTKWNAPLWIRVGYFYGYALSSWLLAFAMLGFFRQFFSSPSPTIRYLADSSYWLYLVHIPLQFELSIHLASWQVNGTLKFLLYNLLTFTILLPTYHYFVRPTWIGWLLNGRLYPLTKEAAAN